MIAGQQVTYTIVVTNSGPSTAQSVDVKDALPPGVSLDRRHDCSSGSGIAACGGTVCQVGDMAVDEVITITVVGTVDPGVPDGTTLTNTATVFSDTPDPQPGDKTDTAATDYRPLPPTLRSPRWISPTRLRPAAACSTRSSSATTATPMPRT